LGSSGLTPICDFVLWYAKNRERAKYRNLFVDKSASGTADQYAMILRADGSVAQPGSEPAHGDQFWQATSVHTMYAGVQSCLYDCEFDGKVFKLPPNRQWSTTLAGMTRIYKAGRLYTSGNVPRLVRFLEDYPVTELTTLWADLILLGQKENILCYHCFVRSAPVGPSPQEKRFAAYVEGLARAAGHADRHQPLKDYCRGLLLPGERKSVEPMAARLRPDRVQATRQSLHHFVAQSPWSDEAVLAAVRRQVLPAIQRRGPVVAWIVDDTGIPKKGKHSVGVARQYCGQLGKQDNCQVAVSLSVATWEASLPVAWRLYLPKEWAEDRARRQRAGVPEEVGFQTKPEIAVGMIGKALEEGVPAGVVLADAAYGSDTRFRQALEELGLRYVVGVQGSVSLWRPGEAPLEPKPWSGRGRPTKLLRRTPQHKPLTAREYVTSLGEGVLKRVAWREGTARRLVSRFVAVRVRPAHRDYWRSEPHAELWLLAEWPRGAAEPTKYWLSNLPADTRLQELVRLAKHRWLVERDYLELKQELGLGHFEGRSWRGFHHHATLCIAAYGFLVAERSRFSPSARTGKLELKADGPAADYQPRGSRSEPATV